VVATITLATTFGAQAIAVPVLAQPSPQGPDVPTSAPPARDAPPSPPDAPPPAPEPSVVDASPDPPRAKQAPSDPPSPPESSGEQPWIPEPGARGSFATSVNGPGSGRSAVLLGLGGFAASGAGAPAFALGFAHGLGRAVDLRFNTELAILPGSRGSSAGVLGVIDPSLLFRLSGKRDMGANVAYRVGPEIFWETSDGSGTTLVAVTDGLGASFGSAKFQFTMGLDFPVYVSVSGGRTVTRILRTPLPALRPTIALEGNVSRSASLFLKGGPTFLLNGAGFFYAMILTGVTL
jgi:hypothetical protein